jgi:DNA-binding GntR family transcriptional regulator
LVYHKPTPREIAFVSEDSLHSRLRAAILSLGLAPGQRLSERGLEPEFGASRTPIRAALMRLESEGLVQRDGKTWIVAPLNVDEIRALYEYREILESAAARLAAAHSRRDDLEALAELARSVDAGETPEHSLDAGTSFHLELARMSGNAFLLESMRGVLTRLYRTRWLEVQTAQSRDRVHTEHAAIADSLLAGDSAGAELATVEHLRGTGERLTMSLSIERMRLKAGGISLD